MRNRALTPTDFKELNPANSHLYEHRIVPLTVILNMIADPAEAWPQSWERFRGSNCVWICKT